MNIFIFEPRINLVIALLCFCAMAVLVGAIICWVTKFVGAKIARKRRLKKLREVRYV